MSAFFGDFDSDDAADPSPPDGVALAHIFVAECRRVTGDGHRPKTLEEVDVLERAMLLYVFAAIVDRLKEEWSR